MSAQKVAFFADRLAQKEYDYEELQLAFNKYKLKNKVKLDQLRKDVTAYCNSNGISISERENNALLLVRMAELEHQLDESRSAVDDLHAELDKRQIHLNDQNLVIRTLEEQLRLLDQSGRPFDFDERQKGTDVEKFHQQMLYKDERIVELNNVILDKERQILDLQEMCREQGEVASVKTQAMRLVQKRFEAMESRSCRDMATETDASLLSNVEARSAPHSDGARGSSGRSLSPGTAVAKRDTRVVTLTSTTPRRPGDVSPPPLDPSELEDHHAKCAQQQHRDDEEDLPGPSHFHGRNLDQEALLRKKEKKRVTFDLRSSGSTADKLAADEQLAACIMELTSENERMRQQCELQAHQLAEYERKLADGEFELSRIARDGRTQTMKSRAVAQARIKDLEDQMAQQNEKHTVETEKLLAEVESIRNTRDWEVQQNAQLREQLSESKEKNLKLIDELDSMIESNRNADEKMTQSEELMAQMIQDLSGAEEIIGYLETQKHDILDDVDRLKEALLAQDQFIEILEADVIIYEEHIGLLRESLGASKVAHRSLIRSKAFETKLKALEQEKEQISRKSNEDRLMTKALDQKCKTLEEENEKLVSKLCEYEMRDRDEADLAETCKQMERRIVESEERFKREREHFEAQLKSAKSMEAESSEATNVREELESAQTQLTELEKERQRLVSENAELNERAESLCASLFELQRSDAELDQRKTRLESETSELRSQLTSVGEQLERLTSENEDLHKELDEVRRELTATQASSEQAQETRDQLKDELDHARLNMQETIAVKNELDKLRAELDNERQNGRARWDELCQRLLEGESGEVSRKNSMEVQHQEYLIAYEEKLAKLEGELKEAMSQAAAEKAEKKKLKLAVKQLRAKAQETTTAAAASNHVASDPPTAVEPTREECSMQQREVASVQREELSMERHSVDVAPREPQKEASWDSFAPEASQQPPQSAEDAEELATLREETKLQSQQLHDLEDKLKEAELEVELSAQLNAEYSKTLTHMEQQLLTLREERKMMEVDAEHAEMELRLHQMLSEELGHEVDRLREHEKELTDRLDSLPTQASLDQTSEESSGANSEQDADNALTTSPISQPTVVEQEVTISEQDEPRTVVEVVEEMICRHSHSVEQALPTEVENVEDTSNSSTLLAENIILRQCVQESRQMQDDISTDVAKLLELKTELETAVDALKGEIWSLNGQLKASVIDRENLQDRIVDLDTSLAAEKRRADVLDTELSEQVELTEKATRQAAEAENESNRRLAECLEMETRREELEKNYAQLTEYYNQLQSAYNALYTRMKEQEAATVTTSSSQQSSSAENTSESSSTAEEEVSSSIDTLLTALSLTLPAGAPLRMKLAAIQECIKEKLVQMEESRTVISEQRATNEALTSRLNSVEEEQDKENAKLWKDKLNELEGDLEWKEEECSALQRRVNELEDMLNAFATAQNESEAAEACRLRTELAILAAKLATRQADVDSLFRTNAELAHANVALQNELDEQAEQHQQKQVETLSLPQSAATTATVVAEPAEPKKMSLSDDEDEEDDLRPIQEAQRQQQQELRDLREKVESLTSRLSAKEEHARSLEAQLEAASSRDADGWGSNFDDDQEPEREEIEELSATVDTLKHELAEKNGHVQSLKDQMDQLAKRMDETMEESQSEKESKNVEIESLTELLADFSSKLRDKEEQVAALERQLEEKASEVDAWGCDEPQFDEGERQKLTEEVATLKQELSERDDQLRSLQVQLAEASDRERDVRAESQALQARKDEEIDVLHKEISSLTNQLCDKVEQVKTLAVQLQKKTDVDGWNDSQFDEESQQKLAEEVKKLRSELTSKNEQVDSLQQQLNKLKQREAELSKETLSHQEQYEEEIDELRCEISSLNKQLVEKEDQLKTMAAQLEEKTAADGWGDDAQFDEEAQQKLTEELDSLKAELAAKSEQVSALYQQLKELKQLEDEMADDSLAQQERKDEEIADLRIEISSLTRQLQAKEEQVKELTVQLEEKADADDGWGESTQVDEESQQRLTEEVDALKAELESKSEQLAALQQQLKELKRREAELIKESQSQQEQKDDEIEHLSEKVSSLTSELDAKADEILSLAHKVEELTLAARQQAAAEQVASDVKASAESEEVEAEPEEAEESSDAWGWGDDDVDVPAEDVASEQKAEAISQSAIGGGSSEEANLIREQLVECQQSLANSETKRAALEQELLEVQDVCRKQQNEIESCSRELENANAETSEMQEELRVHMEKLQNVESMYAALKAQVEEQTKQTASSSSNSQKEMEDSRALVEKLETELREAVGRLQRADEQNGLLKDSESRLIESVDEFAAQAERYQEESTRLQGVVNNLERERAALLESQEALKNSERQKKVELERLAAERASLEQRVKQLEESLKKAAENKLTMVAESGEKKIRAPRPNTSTSTPRPSSQQTPVSQVVVDTPPSSSAVRLNTPEPLMSSFGFADQGKEAVRRRPANSKS